MRCAVDSLRASSLPRVRADLNDSVADATDDHDAQATFAARAIRAARKVRVINLGAVIVPLAGFALAIVMAWGRAVDWTHLALLAGCYLATGFGITVGFHRLFTHRSFAAVRPVQWVLAILGSMAVQGPLLKWVAQHRMHHQHSDEEGDPHSPNLYGTRWWQILHGFWHAHTGWLFDKDSSDLDRYAGDLKKERGLRVINQLFVLWVAVGLLVPAVLGGVLTWSWTGVLLGFIWGGLVRIFLQHHITWSINSVCHLWGRRPFETDDLSRNNFIFGILAMGEGWHNNHHAFPTSARHGLRWWQVDGSYLVIRLLKATHLAWNIRLPDASAIATKQARHQPAGA